MKDPQCATRSILPQMERLAPKASQAGAERREGREALDQSAAAPPRVGFALQRTWFRAARRSWSFRLPKSRAPLCPGLRGPGAKGITFVVVMFAILVGGCGIEPSDPPTVQSWQQNLEKYVWDRGNGDPNVLADLSWDDVHRGFAVIGDPLPDRSTDQIGLLVAHRMFHGKPYFVFLLATVRRQELEDLRAVALQVEGDAFHWAIGVDDPMALALYRDWSEAARARDGGGGLQPPPFPGNESFLVTIEDDEFVIRHSESGAQWRVQPTPWTGITASRPAKN